MNTIVIGLAFLSLQLLLCTADMISSIAAAQTTADIHAVVKAAAANVPKGSIGPLTDACTFHDAATRSSFDLSPLELSSTSSYNVKDTFDYLAKNYTYVFNVCGAAQKPAPDCGSDEDNANGNAYTYTHHLFCMNCA